MSGGEGRGLKWKDRMLIATAGMLVGPVLNGLAATMKIETRGEQGFCEALTGDRNIILVGWHGEIVPYAIATRRMGLPPFAGMVSRSKDGEIAARMIGSFTDFKAIRASSSRGGARGVLEFRRAIRPGTSPEGVRMGAHALDGPRGPRHKAKAGIVMLARLTGSWVLPMVTGIAPRLVLRRAWDRHRIPLPFARIAVLFGEPMDFGESREAPTDEELAAGTLRLEAALRALAESHPLAAADYAIP